MRGDKIVQIEAHEFVQARVLDVHELGGVLGRVADFIFVSREGEEKPARPPLDVVHDVIALRSYDLPRLDIVAGIPLFLPDGSLLAENGYNPSSGAYLHLTGLTDNVDVDMPLAEAVRLLSVELTASYIGLAAQTVRNRAGEIPGRKRLGRKAVYDRLVLDRWIDRNSGRTDLFLDGARMMK